MPGVMQRLRGNEDLNVNQGGQEGAPEIDGIELRRPITALAIKHILMSLRWTPAQTCSPQNQAPVRSTALPEKRTRWLCLGCTSPG